MAEENQRQSASTRWLTFIKIYKSQVRWHIERSVNSNWFVQAGDCVCGFLDCPFLRIPD